MLSAYYPQAQSYVGRTIYEKVTKRYLSNELYYALLCSHVASAIILLIIGNILIIGIELSYICIIKSKWKYCCYLKTCYLYTVLINFIKNSLFSTSTRLNKCNAPIGTICKTNDNN